MVDGLKGFPEAINTVFPETTIQTCIAHLIRDSLDFASWKDRKAVAAVLKKVYRTATARRPPWRWTRLTLARGARNTPIAML
ncbi:transposase, mutator type [Burkholderia lata]|uniref:Mutator family transposase n=1 Tax=Burkholderia lata (strain ATCC 17760 / DSM 23089 / LMG 22485 / NCIMB 9086 / R18194 / 383) TaxID=482957 RepID=A0A6P2NTH0_BURL3|nr:transposase, mutator type [Burkholderia lata]